MKICLAQIKPIKADIQGNINKHLQLIDAAIPGGADTIIFPELSLTGYEPTVANELATTPDDCRFTVFQERSNLHNITIGIGLPVKKDSGITISLLIFSPNKQKELYTKQHLHPDEEPYFISSYNALGLLGKNASLALSICHELSVPAHAEKAFLQGAKIYLASVAKSAKGVEEACTRLATIGKEYSMTVLMVNCIGLCDGMECGGRSSIWNNKGELLAQLDNTREGLLLFDTETKEFKKTYLSA